MIDVSRKMNCILKHIKTENITDTDILTKAVIAYVGKKLMEVKIKRNSNSGGKGGLKNR